ncbi:hypothetical protein OBK25_01110 [Empedobacter falsenii]
MGDNKKLMIVHHTLDLGGGEKLTVELAKFYKLEGYDVSIIIPNNLKNEYYDNIVNKIGVKVIRFKLISRKHLFKNKLFDVYWNVKIKYILKYFYHKVIFVNLSSCASYHKRFHHKRKIFWHVGNSVQYKKNILPFDREIFDNPNNTIVLINNYQKEEILKQYGRVKSKIVELKLFENE